VSMQFQYSWIYLIAPIIGMALAVPIAQTVISKNPPLQHNTEL
jgi:glycerol uptake facilitator-like aquaporin